MCVMKYGKSYGSFKKTRQKDEDFAKRVQEEEFEALYRSQEGQMGTTPGECDVPGQAELEQNSKPSAEVGDGDDFSDTGKHDAVSVVEERFFMSLQDGEPINVQDHSPIASAKLVVQPAAGREVESQTARKRGKKSKPKQDERMGSEGPEKKGDNKKTVGRKQIQNKKAQEIADLALIDKEIDKKHKYWRQRMMTIFIVIIGVGVVLYFFNFLYFCLLGHTDGMQSKVSTPIVEGSALPQRVHLNLRPEDYMSHGHMYFADTTTEVVEAWRSLKEETRSKIVEWRKEDTLSPYLIEKIGGALAAGDVASIENTLEAAIQKHKEEDADAYEDYVLHGYKYFTDGNAKALKTWRALKLETRLHIINLNLKNRLSHEMINQIGEALTVGDAHSVEKLSGELKFYEKGRQLGEEYKTTVSSKKGEQSLLDITKGKYKDVIMSLFETLGIKPKGSKNEQQFVKTWEVLGTPLRNTILNLTKNKKITTEVATQLEIGFRTGHVGMINAMVNNILEHFQEPSIDFQFFTKLPKALKEFLVNPAETMKKSIATWHKLGGKLQELIIALSSGSAFATYEHAVVHIKEEFVRGDVNKIADLVQDVIYNYVMRLNQSVGTDTSDLVKIWESLHVQVQVTIIKLVGDHNLDPQIAQSIHEALKKGDVKNITSIVQQINDAANAKELMLPEPMKHFFSEVVDSKKEMIATFWNLSSELQGMLIDLARANALTGEFESILKEELMHGETENVRILVHERRRVKLINYKGGSGRIL